jgi:hypothetical protein
MARKNSAEVRIREDRALLEAKLATAVATVEAMRGQIVTLDKALSYFGPQKVPRDQAAVPVRRTRAVAVTPPDPSRVLEGGAWSPDGTVAQAAE